MKNTYVIALLAVTTATLLEAAPQSDMEDYNH